MLHVILKKNLLFISHLSLTGYHLAFYIVKLTVATELYFLENPSSAREMAQWLKILATLSEDLGLISSKYGWLTIVCNSTSRGCDILFWPLRAPGMNMVHIHTGKTPI